LSGPRAVQLLRRVHVQRQQLDAVALAQQPLQVGAEGRGVAAQRIGVGAQAGQVDRQHLGVERGRQAEDRGAEGHGADLHQAQHLLAADAGAVDPFVTTFHHRFLFSLLFGFVFCGVLCG